MLDDSILDDSERLDAADADGLLRAVALAGAQVRSTAEVAREVGLEGFSGERPRALVLLARPGVGPATTRLLAALLGPSNPVPVVVSASVPSWVGPLDTVFACTDDPGDTELAESLDLAGRRGARVVVSAPDEGPVAAAAAGQAVLLRPRVPVPPGLGFAAAYTAGLCLLVALGLLDHAMPEGGLDALADELDAEAARDHPGHESLVNPAKTVALRLADRAPLLWGMDEPASAVAEYAAFTLAARAGVVASAAPYPQARTASSLFRRVNTGEVDDVFADPEDVPAGLPRAFLLAVEHGDHAQATRRVATSAMPSADVVEPESVPEGSVLRAGLIALRFDFAAVYLGLAAGTSGPSWGATASS